MTITPKTVFLALTVSFILLLIWSSRSPSPMATPSQSTSTPAAYQTKESEAANVTVSVTPITLKVGFPASFDIAFETHSVELDFDVEAIASLTDGNGIVYTPTWQGSPPGGHHRSGTLIFTPDIPRNTTLTLTLNDIAGVPERVFIWSVY